MIRPARFAAIALLGLLSVAATADAGLILNLRFADGSNEKLLSSANVNSSVPIQVWATIDTTTGNNGAGTLEGLQYVFFGLESARLTSGSINGALTNSVLVAPFNAQAGSQSGTFTDFNGDNIADLGNPAQGGSSFAKPRAASAVPASDPSATVRGTPNGAEFLVATVDFRIQGLPATAMPGNGTRILPFLPSLGGLPIANWWQNSVGNDGFNAGPFAVGTSVLFRMAMPWQNPLLPPDVDGNSQIQALDALQIINQLNATGPRSLGPPPQGSPPPFYDVNGDAMLTAQDALVVINRINSSQQVQALSLVGVPEPSTFILGLFAAVGLGWYGYRKRKAA